MRCRLRYLNAAPADVCLTCDGALGELPVPSAPPEPRPTPDADIVTQAILEGWQHD